jgi:3-dehydroquinate synthase
MSTEIVKVGLGVRSYDIIAGEGVLAGAGDHLAPLLRRPFAAIVTDDIVNAAHGERLRSALSASGVKHETISLPPGEATKSFARLEELTEKLLGLGVERGDLVIAFGGGVIGDLTGFAAAILRRGCRFAQIPTTLLAQVDSSVGGKTAVNARHGKNLVGAFHQPAIVLADIGVLDTLPARQMRAGYAEIVKYGALGDALLFAWLETNGLALLSGDNEREDGVRALLNLGHTFGHALEALCGYSDRLLHGEAVAAGMGLAFDFSAAEGLCAAEDAARLKSHLRACGLPAGIADIDGAKSFAAGALLAAMLQDKKVEQGRLTLILARRLGEAFVARDVPVEKVERFLAAQLR